MTEIAGKGANEGNVKIIKNKGKNYKKTRKKRIRISSYFSIDAAVTSSPVLFKILYPDSTFDTKDCIGTLLRNIRKKFVEKIRLKKK